MLIFIARRYHRHYHVATSFSAHSALLEHVRVTARCPGPWMWPNSCGEPAQQPYEQVKIG